MGRSGDGDDGAGVAFVRAFGRKGGAGERAGWRCEDVGTVPENAGGVIRRAPGGLVVVVDAADLGLSAGEVRRVRPEELESAGFGTHAPEPVLLDGYLRSAGAREVAWVGIQAERLEGRGLSRAVREGLRRLGRVLGKGAEGVGEIGWWEGAGRWDTETLGPWDAGTLGRGGR